MDTNAYKLIADKCRFSEKTIRNAFSKKPIPYQTAVKIARALDIDTVDCFTIKTDKRGKRGKKKPACQSAAG